MVNFVTATSSDFSFMESLANSVWHETFDPIIGSDQVNYMLEKFQSVTAFSRQTTVEGYTYYLIVDENGAQGYIALCDDKSDRLYMSKLYLCSSARGKGYARLALEMAVEKAKMLGKRSVYLTVNKGNLRAIAVYEKCGFSRVDSIKADIGNGYFMDDFVYEKQV